MAKIVITDLLNFSFDWQKRNLGKNSVCQNSHPLLLRKWREFRFYEYMYIFLKGRKITMGCLNSPTFSQVLNKSKQRKNLCIHVFCKYHVEQIMHTLLRTYSLDTWRKLDVPEASGRLLTQPAVTCWKLTIETLEQGVKYNQS